MRNVICSLVAGLALLAPSRGHAQQTLARLQANLIPGRPVLVSVQGSPGGAAELVIDSPSTRVPLELPAPNAGAVQLEVVEISGGKLVHLKSTSASGLADEALVGLRRGRPTVAWSAVTGLRGDAGERTGLVLRFEDLTGDGKPEAVVSQLSEAVRLCGVGAAPLFPRAFDPASGEMRPILMNRLRALPRGRPLAGSWQSPGPSGPPLARVANFASASTMLGDAGDAVRLSPPLTLGDGDLHTSWAEGRGGDGRHEFITATVSPGYAIRALGVILSPEGTTANARLLGRPTELTLLFEPSGGGSAPIRYEVTMPGDPAERPGQTVWVPLPEPLSAQCLSVVLGGSLRGSSANAATHVVEIRVYSDLDFGAGAERLVRDLARPGDTGEQAARLLASMGTQGAVILSSALGELHGSARFLAARVLADIREPAAIGALTTLLGERDERIRAEAIRGLGLLGEAAIEPLRQALSGQDTAIRTGAATALGRLGTPAALEVLVARAGQGERSERRAVREAIALGARTPANLLLLEAHLSAATETSATQTIEIARALELRTRTTRQSVAAALVRIAEGPGAVLDHELGFASSFHLIQLAGRLCALGERQLTQYLLRVAAPADPLLARFVARRGDSLACVGGANGGGLCPVPWAPTPLRSVATGTQQRGGVRGGSRGSEPPPRSVNPNASREILRAEALAGVGHCGFSASRSLRAALEDPHSRVRAAALQGLRALRDTGAAALIARRARRDGWAFVRAQALESLLAVAPEFALPAVTSALTDPAAEVRRTAIGLAVQLRIRGASSALGARAASETELADLRQDAIYAIGTLCAADQVALLARVARRGRHPAAGAGELAAAGAAIEALGRIGGSAAREELRAARRSSSPPLLQSAARRAAHAGRCTETPTTGTGGARQW